MKILKVFAALLLFSILFLWGGNLNPQRILFLHFPVFHIILFVCFCGFYIFFRKNFHLRYQWSGILIKYRYFIFPVIGFFSALSVSIFVFQEIPHIQDGINYLVMSQNFASGQLYHKMHDHYEFFRMLYLIPDGQNVHSLFMPGFSIFLTPFTFFKVPFLANPVLTALNIFLSGKIAEKLFDKETSFIAMVFLLVSSFIIVMGGTFMAHSFCASMTLAVIYCFIVARDDFSIILSVLCGVFMGFLMLTRPQNALFLTMPLSFIVLLNIKNRTMISSALIAFMSFLPFLVILFVTNYSYTGDIFMFKQDIYFNYSEPGTLCHRFGLGTGCPNSNWETLPLEGLTWTHAFFITFKRISPLIMNLLLHPLMLLFAVAGFIFVKTKKHFYELSFLLSIFLFTVAGYFFFYFDGNVFGPRYYYETSFLLMICTAYGFRSVFGSEFGSKKMTVFTKALSASLFSASFTVHAFIVYPALISVYSLGFWCVDAKLKDSVEKMGISNAVVFVSPEEMYGSGFILMDHSNYEANDIIYLRDLGESQNQRIFEYYPDRKFYMAKFEKGDKNTEPPEIKELSFETEKGSMRIELEYKKYPLKGVPDYCNIFPERDYLDRYLTVKTPYSAIAKDTKLFFCRFTNKDQFYTFGQYFYTAGKYQVTISGITGETGSFNIYIDDRYAGTVDFSSVPETRMGYFSFETNIEKGFRNIKIEPSDIRDQYEYFFIDYIDFIIKPD